MTAIDFEVDGKTYTATMIGHPSEYYPQTMESPAEYPECDFKVEDEYGVEIVDLCSFDEDTLKEIEDDLLEQYGQEMIDDRAEYQIELQKEKEEYDNVSKL